MVEIVPAILTNDVADFRLKYSQLLALGHHFSKIHIDFIDGEFLSEKTIMPSDLKFLATPFHLMAHFMTLHPENYFEDAKAIGFEWIIVHFEAFKTIDALLDCLDKAKNMKLKIGVCINPETPLHKIAKALPLVDLVQIMGVHPGAQGRVFEPNTFEKIKELKSLRGNVIISVDGGIKLGIAGKCVRAGAYMIIIGSGILHATHPKEALEAFKRELELI